MTTFQKNGDNSGTIQKNYKKYQRRELIRKEIILQCFFCKKAANSDVTSKNDVKTPKKRRNVEKRR